MCGIVGYVGKRQALPVLMDGLRRMEYRGYDSAGIAVMDDADLRVAKSVGKVRALADSLVDTTVAGTLGIAHTRWATHGVPSEANAHPHVSCDGKVALVHNGIIESYAELRAELTAAGHAFASETDTETLAHLVEHLMRFPGVTLADAVRSAVRRVRGTFGLAVVSTDYPNEIIVARLGSPIVIGVGEGEYLVASDPNAIIGHTRSMIFLDDGEMAVLNRDGYRVVSLENLPVAKHPENIDWSAEDAQKNGHAHFMMKEMSEQPEVLRNTMRGRIDFDAGNAVLGGLRDVAGRTREIDRLIIVGCGSAYYAAQVGEYMLEEYAGIPVEVELASEFRYRKPIITPRTAVIAVSQSGETADTLAAIREARMKGALTLGIVNAVGSTIARETDAGIYNHAGPEIGVASTKAFLSQATVFALLTMFLGRQRQMSVTTGRRISEELARIPDLVASLLARQDEYKAIADKYAWADDFLYLGRKYCAPLACEGALKLKEVSYVHAEGYAAGEMKHGPIALVDETMPSIVICPVDSVYEKTKSCIEELRARRGKVIAITTEGNHELDNLADDVIFIPKTLEMLTPILAAIPLQAFAYHAAVRRGFDPDMPRNLAKSVTVE